MDHTIRAIGIALFAGLLTLPADLGAQTEAPLGLWVSETVTGTSLSGKLVVMRNGAEWTARISSVEARFRLDGDSVRFRFPGELGEFRGVLAPNGPFIRGFWVQPKDPVPKFEGDAGGLGQPVASPLSLILERPDFWSGEVVPLEDRYTLYLSIWKAPSGSVVASFRNPEQNHRGGNSTFRVTKAGDSLVFSVAGDSTQPGLRRAAYVNPTTRQVVMFWPQLRGYVALAPRDESQATRLFPRLPRGLKYSYSPPLPANDGLKSARAREVGMDEAQLAKLVQRIADTIPNLPRAPFIHSLLVARKGKLVLEEYFAGYDRDTPHDTRSATKTFPSVMLGALIQEGNKVRADTRIADLLSNLAPFANPDPRKQQITLGHLLTHSSGLACDDNQENSLGNEETMQSQSKQPNWWKYILDLPMTHDPGSWYAYCSGGSNLVGAGVAAAAKAWLPEVFDRTIARPLQFGRYYYNLLPTGEGYAGGGVFMRPRDLLKVGQLYLDSGVWNGKQIVPKSWVLESTKKQIEWAARGENLSAGSDGLAWHLGTTKVGDKTYRNYGMGGNGGQLVMVIPELELVVVFTAGNYGNYGVWGRFGDDLVPNAIIPALRP